LGKEVDRLGIDCNEASWAIGWVMECYEKGVLLTTTLF
jgi:aldehyde:ferredoxin oxidoreductase